MIEGVDKGQRRCTDGTTGGEVTSEPLLVAFALIEAEKRLDLVL